MTQNMNIMNKIGVRRASPGTNAKEPQLPLTKLAIAALLTAALLTTACFKGGVNKKIAEGIAGAVTGRSADSSLDGTWVSADGYQEWTFKNGNFEASILKDPMVKGTYTAKDGNIELAVNEFYGGNIAFSMVFEKKWYTKEKARDAIKSNPLFQFGGAQEMEDAIDQLLSAYKGGKYTVKDKTLTLDGTAYTQK